MNMGTGTSLKVTPNPPTEKLPVIEEEKVSNIQEICNVSRDEALRVLDACHMDETMAIERFLNGNEVSTWSQVSKKKKPAGGRSTSTSRGGSTTYSRGGDRDRDRDRRDRSQHQSEHGNRRGYRQHGYSQKPRDNSAASKKRLPPQKSPTEELPLPVTNDVPEAWVVPQSTETWGGETQNIGNGETWNDGYPNNSEVWTDQPADPAETVGDKSWNESTQSISATPNAWGNPEPSPDVHEATAESKKSDHESPNMTTSRAIESSLKPPVVASFNKVKRNFNYAAAAATGTSHEKPKPAAVPKSSPSELSSTVSKEPTANVMPLEEEVSQTAVDNLPPRDSVETKKRRSRNPRKSRSRSEGERQTHHANGDRSSEPSPEQELSELEKFDSHTSSVASNIIETRPEPAAPQPNAWSSPPQIPKDKTKKVLPDAIAPTTVTSSNADTTVGDQSAGDTLSLQFGSFGLGGLDAAVWSAENKAPEPVVNPILPVESKPVIQEAPIAPVTAETTKVPEPVPAAVPQTQVQIPAPEPPVPAQVERVATITSSQDVRQHLPSTSSVPLPSASGSVSGSGMVPLLPVAPGGNFAPPNYGGTTYLMPPQHGYSPALGSYENSAELGSSRAPNIGPSGSLPLYDPSSLPGMPTGNAKYTGIPGLGDMSGVPGIQTGVSKESLHASAQDMDKANSIGTTGLPAGMDPLAAPYVIPGYPSMQYIYPFHTGPYPPPPGMAPPGPNPFPYPPGGQVSSQGARGGFGFEDGSIAIGGNSRSGSGLGESMYTPGYLNTTMPHTSSQKPPSDGSYKQIRGNPGNALGGMGMAGGVVHGMTYGDYTGVPGGSNSIGNNGAGPRNWNTHQANGNRADGGGPGVGNQSIGGANQNSSVYASGAGGAPGAYWAQQGGYYP